MSKSPEQYQPSPEEIKKGEEMMTEEEKALTQERWEEEARRESLLRHQKEMNKLAEDIERTRRQFNDDMDKFWRDFERKRR